MTRGGKEMFWKEDEMITCENIHAMYVIPPDDGGI
jgi:hypothetical protein